MQVENISKKIIFFVHFFFYFSFKACPQLGRNCCHWWGIQGAKAVRLQGEISCFLFLSFGLVRMSWIYYCKITLSFLECKHVKYVIMVFLLQHIRLPHWDHCFQRSRAWISGHQYWGGRLLGGFPVHPFSLVRKPLPVDLESANHTQ